MFDMMIKFFQKKPKTEAELQLEKIKNLLFPPMEEGEMDGIKFLVDYSVDQNLEAALIDLEEDHNDEACRNTIRKVAKKLYDIRVLMDAYSNKLDKDFKYIIVDDVRAMEDGRY
jgi:hypothetical protein